MHDDQLLAHVERALQQLRLDSLQLGAAFEQRFQAHRVLDPQRLPQRDRLVGGLDLALVERLRLAGVAAGELRVQMCNRLADELGDRRPVTRSHLRSRQRAQLVQQRLVRLADVGKWQRLDPPGRGCRVGKREFGRIRGVRHRNTLFLPFCDLRIVDGGFLHAALQQTASTVGGAGTRPFGQSSKISTARHLVRHQPLQTTFMLIA